MAVAILERFKTQPAFAQEAEDLLSLVDGWDEVAN